jgi:hypothetical protein
VFHENNNAGNNKTNWKNFRGKKHLSKVCYVETTAYEAFHRKVNTYQWEIFEIEPYVLEVIPRNISMCRTHFWKQQQTGRIS